MKITNRVLSAVTALLFIFNTVTADIALGQLVINRPSSDKLAAPSKLDDITGVMGSDMGRIDFILRYNLLKAMARDGLVDIGALKKAIGSFQDSQRQPKLEFLDHSQVRFLANEAEQIGDYWHIVCRFKDLTHGMRTYHAIFPRVLDIFPQVLKDRQSALPIYE